MRVELTVRGLVQGVYFRASMEEEGRRLGVRGWVRNRDDGGVDACAEGPREALEELVRWAHHGPPAARVDGVDVRFSDDERGEPSAEGFRVVR